MDSTPSRFPFTKAAIESLPTPRRGRLLVHDAKVRGLVLRVTPSGAKSAYLYRKFNGRACKRLICKWPDWTVEQIRNEAERLNARIASGIDVFSERRDARKASTLGELWEWYLENHAKPHKKSWQTDEWQYKRFLEKEWHHKRLADIKPADLKSLHSTIGKDTGTVPANRLRSLLHTLFEVAQSDLGFKGPNPVKGIRPFPESPRERYLSPAELPRFMQALDSEPNPMLADFFRLALFTGARRGNLQSAEWEEFDLTAGVWTIPADKAKGKRPISIPLGKEAIAVLERRKKDSIGQPWVFPGRGKKGHLVEPKSAWKRICEAAGLKAVRLHDLRHTTASWMIAGGASLYTVGKTLGHANQQTTQRYAHLDLTALRTALSGATGAMSAATKAAAKASTRKAKRPQEGEVGKPAAKAARGKRGSK